MKLLSHLSPDGGGLPEPADSRHLGLGFEAWDEALAAAAGDPAAQAARGWSALPSGRHLLAAIFGNSPFLSGLAVKEWRFLTRLVADGADPLFDETVAAVETPGNSAEDAASLMRRLRIAKRHTALLAAVAEFAGIWSLEQQMAALSRFAEAAVGASLRHLLRQASAKGMIVSPDAGDPERDSGLIVLGMGKLGGGELNYSSDIDLILFYDAARARVTAREGIQPFFSRVARDLVRLLEERTGDGYVFRTDLRLRPDPGSTPAAMSVAAAMAYYESVGQNWERAALIKARPVAGDRVAGKRLLRELRPFLWRRHLDFAAIQDIHSIKRQINAHRGGGRIAVEGHDIKIGRGGIREIEFFAQTQQLIWGGRLPQLRVRSTCEALRRLAACGRIDAATAGALIDDYRFLRRVEHRLQMVDDQQTHRLPSDRDGIGRLAAFLGYRGPAGFAADLTAHLSSVERHYAELFEQAPSLAGPGNLVFTGTEDDPETLATLARLGFADPAAVAALVRGWHHGRLRAIRSQRVREILTELVPELLRIFGATPHPDEALRRFDQFLSHLSAGVQLFSLFQANPGLLALVADVMAGAPRLAEQLAQRPALLDAVLTHGYFAPLPDRAGLAEDVAGALAGAADFADTLDALRRWAGERRFQVGVQLLRRALDGEQVGKALADIAETALAALVPVVEAEFARRHGPVPGGAFAVIGMGRLGSREMTLASDLDLILIYDAPPGVESVRRRAAALGVRLLRQAEPAADRRDHRADRRGRALPGRHAAAALGCGRPDRLEPRKLCPLPARIGLDLGAHGADPRPCGGRRRRAVPPGRRHHRGGAAFPARPGPPADRCRRDAPPHRRGKPAALALGPQKPAWRADRPRIHRAIPDAARGPRIAANPLPRHRPRIAGAGRRRGAAAAGRARAARGAGAAAPGTGGADLDRRERVAGGRLSRTGCHHPRALYRGD